MDPFTITSVVSAALTLAVQSGKIALALKNLAERYSSSEVKILAMKQQCDTLKLAWDRIKKWCEFHEDSAFPDQLLLRRLSEDLEFGAMIMSTLERDVSFFVQAPRSAFWQRTKIVWNEDLFQDHQCRLDRHVISTMLLLQTTQLPNHDQRTHFLTENEKKLDECHESAWTVTRSCTSSIHGSQLSMPSATSLPLSYRTLDINEELFQGRVYQRNGWNITVARLIKRKPLTTLLSNPSIKGQAHSAGGNQTLSCETPLDHERNENLVNTKSIQNEGGDPTVDPTPTTDSDGEPTQASLHVGLKKEISSCNTDPQAWLVDLIDCCKTGRKEIVGKLLVGRYIYCQPKDAWFFGGSEAMMAAVSYDQPEVLRVLLDHCVFTHTVITSSLLTSLLEGFWSSRTEFGSTQEFFCQLSQIADSLGNLSVKKELMRLDLWLFGMSEV